MIKIIKYGFQPITHDCQRGQNMIKGQKLYESGHVIEVEEIVKGQENSKITGKIVAQTKICNVYDVKITLDSNRHIENARCKCKAGLSAKCKHICALIYYINSPNNAISKTSEAQWWGKPSHRQLLGYDKGVKMTELFPPPQKSPKLLNLMSHLESQNVSTNTLGPLLANTPLYKILQLEEKNEKEIMAAETLVELVQITERNEQIERINQVTLDIFTLQCTGAYYSSKTFVPGSILKFYNIKVCCNVDSGRNICLGTINQANNSQWYMERRLRITASNAHRVKGNCFNIDKVISDLLSRQKIQTPAMAYGKKMEDVALIEYQKIYHFEVVKVGLVVNLYQPWLSCSPDGIVIYGNDIGEKGLIEIKCPTKCKNVPVFEEDNAVINVPYLHINENGLQLKKNHSIFTQVQIQMYVTNISICHLFIYSPKGSQLVIVKKDNMFLSNLVPQLETFYFNYYLPKLFSQYIEEEK